MEAVVLRAWGTRSRHRSGQPGCGGFRSIERVPASLGRRADIESGRARWRRPALEADGTGPANRADRPSRGERETDELPYRPGTTTRCRETACRKKCPALLEQLPRLIEPEAGGDPEGKRKFVRVSLRGYPVIIPCDSRYLNGAGRTDSLGFKYLNMR